MCVCVVGVVVSVVMSVVVVGVDLDGGVGDAVVMVIGVVVSVGVLMVLL